MADNRRGKANTPDEMRGLSQISRQLGLHCSDNNKAPSLRSAQFLLMSSDFEITQSKDSQRHLEEANTYVSYIVLMDVFNTEKTQLHVCIVKNEVMRRVLPRITKT